MAQTSVDPRTCTLVCARDGKQVWSQPVCAAASSDFVFVAEDCSIAMVLFEYPMRGTPTESTHVAATVSGEGAQLYTLEQVMHQPARSKGEGRRVRWLAGAVGEPGVKPHKAGEAGVEFTTVDGTTRTVRFAATGELALRPSSPPVVIPSTGSATTGGAGLYQFVDDEGSTQFVMGIAQVPPRFRKQARPVEAEVSSVKGEKIRVDRSRPLDTSSFEGGRPAVAARKQPPPATGNQEAGRDSSGTIFGLNQAVSDAVMNRRPEIMYLPSGQIIRH